MATGNCGLRGVSMSEKGVLSSEIDTDKQACVSSSQEPLKKPLVALQKLIACLLQQTGKMKSLECFHHSYLGGEADY